jgi:hypothetical protein
MSRAARAGLSPGLRIQSPTLPRRRPWAVSGELDQRELASSHDLLERDGRDEILAMLGDVIGQRGDEWFGSVRQHRADDPWADADERREVTEWGPVCHV